MECMWGYMRQWAQRGVALVLAIGFCWIAWGLPVQARLDFEREHSGQMLYRSFQSLHDSDGQSWQAIAFKRVFDDGHSTYFLRLVGFPDTATVIRLKPLVLTNVRGQTFEAPDSSDRVFTDNAVPDSVGQYDIATIVMQLSDVTPLKLLLPAEDGPVSIAVPPAAIAEWQTVANQ